MYINSILEVVGNTPLLKLNNISKKYNLKANIYAKLEYLNPTGSIIDRTAFYIIDQAEKQGLLKSGATIIEATSGNTGIGLAMASKVKGYKLILTMPSSMSIERQKILKAYGAEIVLTDSDKGMQGSIEKAKELNSQIKGSIIANQFTASANVLAHYETTGKEIYQALDGKVDVFVASIGTSGTLIGTAKYLKEQNKDIKVYGVEPSSSPLLSKGYSGSHKIQGIGANFVPPLYDAKYCDGVLTCSNDDSVKYAKDNKLMSGISETEFAPNNPVTRAMLVVVLHRIEG
ncbi:MAG: cysteine synthase family protein, partial [Clostridia bacterium]|nr:cysteine synthase family protein [Clostridia bacterium]